MNNDANTIVKTWLSSKKQQENQSPADAIVDRWRIKQEQKSSPLNNLLNAQDNIGSQDYNNLCERFAEQQVYGKSGIFPSAADAWNNYIQEGRAQGGDVEKAPAGSLIYWNPDKSNSGDGHVSISDGQGGMIGATSSGVHKTTISEWKNLTGQQPLGFVIP